MQVRTEIEKLPIHDGSGRHYEIITLTSNCNDIAKAIEHVKITDAVHLEILFESQSEEFFTREFIENLNDFLREIENNPNIKSLYTNLFSNSHIKFSEEQIKLFLTPKLVEKLIYSLSYNNDLFGIPGNFFSSDIRVLLFSEAIYNYFLATPSFRRIFRQCSPANQIFQNSCSAHSIMKYLYGKENREKFNVLTEMEIYKEIWMLPGEFADPRKIKNYLESLDIEVVLIEDEVLVKKVISDFPEAKILHEYTRSLFDEAHYKNGGINEITFPNNSAMLVIIGKGEHAVIAERLADGSIVLQDTFYVAERTFNTVDSFIGSRLEKPFWGLITDKQPSITGFSGLAFNFFHKSKEVSEPCLKVVYDRKLTN